MNDLQYPSTTGTAGRPGEYPGTDDDPDADFRIEPEETARHAGHADILRELIDGQTGP